VPTQCRWAGCRYFHCSLPSRSPPRLQSQQPESAVPVYRRDGVWAAKAEEGSPVSAHVTDSRSSSVSCSSGNDELEAGQRRASVTAILHRPSTPSCGRCRWSFWLHSLILLTEVCLCQCSLMDDKWVNLFQTTGCFNSCNKQQLQQLQFYVIPFVIPVNTRRSYILPMSFIYNFYQISKSPSVHEAAPVKSVSEVGFCVKHEK